MVRFPRDPSKIPCPGVFTLDREIQTRYGVPSEENDTAQKLSTSTRQVGKHVCQSAEPRRRDQPTDRTAQPAMRHDVC